MLKELFPFWEAVQRYKEVVVFVVGLMKDPEPLVQFVYEMQVEDYLNNITTGNRPSIDADLLKSLDKESTVRLFDHPLHNKYINYYNHDEDDWEKRPRDRNSLYPSRLYHFVCVRDNVSLSKCKEQRTEIPECAIYIYRPEKLVVKPLLSMCRMISKHQEVTDFQMWNVRSEDVTKAEAPLLSRKIQSLYIGSCNLALSFMRNVLHQLHYSITLRHLQLQNTRLREAEEDLNKLLDNLVFNHVVGLSNKELRMMTFGNGFTEQFVAKWNERCEGITSIDCYIR